MSILRAKIRGLHWSQWLSFLGLAVLFVALRWNNFNAPLIRDEGEYAYAARLMVQGVAPYQHAFIQKPPGIVYSYALANLFLPQFFWSPRLLAYLFVAVATGLFGFIASLEFGKGFALPAMWREYGDVYDFAVAGNGGGLLLQPATWRQRWTLVRGWFFGRSHAAL
jgi:hypothetical protein